MEWRPDDLLGRLMAYGGRCLRVCGALPRSSSGRWIADQLMRCSTSTGANYEEACAAESRADFLHKMQLVLKELRESRYWLAMAELGGMTSAARLKPIRAEAHELVCIFSKSVMTAKKNRDADPKHPPAATINSTSHKTPNPDPSVRD